MGAWGITERQSDYGLDLLGTIAATQLKAVGFSTFNVAETLEVIKADIMEEIRKANHGCSAEDLVFYFSENFPQKFTHGALLIAECLADYYRTGELIVTEYVGKNYDPVNHPTAVKCLGQCQGWSAIQRRFLNRRFWMLSRRRSASKPAVWWTHSA